MKKKYVSISKLSVFLDNLKNTFASLDHNHTISEITDYAVDSSLSSTSTNPIQNKVVDVEFKGIATAMNALETAVDTKVESLEEVVQNASALIVNIPDEETISHTFNEVLAAYKNGRTVFVLMYNTVLAPLSFVADDESYIIFAQANAEINEDQNAFAYVDLVTIYNDDTFLLGTTELSTQTDIDNKKDKDLIVTYQNGSAFEVTHTSQEILNAVNNGTTVKFRKDTELLNLLEVTVDYATFYMFYINMDGKLQQRIVVVSGNSIMMEQDDTYDYATVSQLNSKADSSVVLTKTEQDLTDDELAQVRRNLRFIGKDVEGTVFIIDGVEVTASANAEIFGDYENNIAIGQWSIAEGSGTLAKGRASHVEGAYGKALQDGAHVEGYGCTASGYWSHAEGEMTVVSSYASHAEGSYCTMPDGTKRYGTASGYASHIEGGGCHASGSCSHAEGLGTTASGFQCHVEGRYTIAAGAAQHVEGVANIEDANSKYIHIAGNGTSPTNRSNAHTLDWNGNGWYAGKLYIGGNNQDDGIEVATKVDLDDLITVDDIDAICGVI